MRRTLIFLLLLLFTAGSPTLAQVPLDVHVTILKAEDSRSFDEPLAALFKHKDATVRSRAALAAGRIGNARAVPALTELLLNDDSPDVRVMAVFALGEIESAEAAEAINRVAIDPKAPPDIRARALEAAGKIVAAHAEDPRMTVLKESIVRVLNIQSKDSAIQNTSVIRAGLTAVLRARPDGGEDAVKPFLAHSSPEVVADALNTLARLRSKAANPDTRELLKSHKDPIVRANAARLLGAAEDKEALDLLITAAAYDADSRVRVSAIRSLAQIKDQKSAATLIARGNTLLADYKRSKFAAPSEKNELLEIATALGLILGNTEHEAAVKLLMEMLEADGGISPEIPIARMRIALVAGQGGYPEISSWRHLSAMVQVIGEVSAIKPIMLLGEERKAEAPRALAPLARAFAGPLSPSDKELVLAAPAVLTSYAKFKTDDLPEIARGYLIADDVFMRVAAANVLGTLPASEKNIEALRKAFDRALATDKHENDAQLAILDALFKLDKAKAVPALTTALNAPDYLIRKKAFDLLENKELAPTPAVAKSLKEARAQGLDRLKLYRPDTGTKLGQVLNTEADYRRAASRRNGNVKAVFTTEKGTFTIDLLPEDAPLTVDNFVKLANAKYFDGLEVHRVVPNFVMQDGDPLGNGSGGPGWSIRCEINMVPYTRGAVGMALSGKDTGGSQWFVTHSPQPHLDGGYTVFGRVNETDMKVVDNIARGDKILTVKIMEGSAR